MDGLGPAPVTSRDVPPVMSAEVMAWEAGPMWSIEWPFMFS